VVFLVFHCSSSVKGQDKFEPTVESLRQYKCPQWFRDAKFGIYLHWGVYSVAEKGEWYGRDMYIEGSSEYKHHLETYGHPSKFGYKDFIPMWKAEKFDADKLVSLFKRAGAKYFTPCAVHHDNFDLWNSQHNKWNSVNMGPKKDIIGLWRDAALKHGLRFGVTTHLERSYSWFNVNKGADKSGPYKGIPYDGNDPEYAGFYHERHEDTDYRQPLNPPKHWRDNWAERIKDLIDNYQIDFLYFDGAVPFQGEDKAQTGLQVIAYYYNQSIRRHGRQECVMTIKKIENHGTYVDGIATIDMERHRSDELLEEPWQTDTSIGPWGYYAGAQYRSVSELVHELVDIVSKNGNVLLNVPPKADGTLDDETVKILLGIGKWLDVNGEAIYETRPWTTYGQKATLIKPGQTVDKSDSIEVRFTKKLNDLYIITLGSPPAGSTIVIKSVWATTESPGKKIQNVALLGCDSKLKWEYENDSLEIHLPNQKPCEHALAFEVTFNP